MTFSIRRYEPADRAAFAALLAQPGLAEAFDLFQGESGLAALLDDTHNHPGGVLVAHERDTLVGFGIAHLLPGRPAGWATMRLGVLPAHRRRGIARALVAALEAHACEHRSRLGLTSIGSSAYVPDPVAEGFAAAMQMEGERWFWVLERPRAPIDDPAWPEGIRVETYNGTTQAREGWRLAYNDSFAGHYRSIPVTPEEMQHLVSRRDYRPDGTLLAWRGDEVVGFARNTLYGPRPELAILGTTTAARGIGLGRALLRWSVRWMTDHASGPATLLVDGDNDTALKLYASEGFEIARRRRIWARPLAGD